MLRIHSPAGLVPAALLFLVAALSGQTDAEQQALLRAHKALAKGAKVTDTHYWTLDGHPCYGTYLHRGALEGHLSVVRLLVDKGAPVNGSNFDIKGPVDGKTPLALAARGGHLEVMKFLLERGADPHHRNLGGDSPLYCAALYGRLAAVKLLVGKGAKPVAPAGAQTPLHAAAGAGNIVIAEYLLAHGAVLDHEAEYRGTALQHAAAHKQYAVMVLLVLKGARVKPGKHGRNPLLAAATGGDLGLIKLLLHRGAPINEKERTDSALHLAVKARNTKLMVFLLHHGAHPSHPGHYLRTPLHLAAESGDAGLVNILLDAGADPARRDHWKKTPLDVARGGYIKSILKKKM